MKNRLSIFTLVFVLFIVTGCDTFFPPAATEESVIPAQVTEDPAVTPEPAVTEDPALFTPQPVPTDDTSAPSIDTSQFTLSVSSLLGQNLPDGTPDAPEGSRWVLAVTSVANRSEAAVTIEQEDIRMVDDQGNIYTAEAADAGTTPPLIGLTLPPDTNQRVLVRFAIPEDATPNQMQWCLDDTCDSVVMAAVPPVN